MLIWYLGNITNLQNIAQCKVCLLKQDIKENKIESLKEFNYLFKLKARKNIYLPSFKICG